ATARSPAPRSFLRCSSALGGSSMPMRPSPRLVVAGLASLLVALVLVVGFAGRPTPSPTASAAAGAQAWAMIDHLFHVDGRPPAPVPAPAPLDPVSSLLDAVTSLVSGLLGLLGGG